MYDTSDIKKNLKIKIEGVPFTVVDFQFVKPGKGNAFTRTKLRNMFTGAVIELLLQIGGGSVCGRRFAGLGPFRTPLDQASAPTASLQ